MTPEERAEFAYLGAEQVRAKFPWWDRVEEAWLNGGQCVAGCTCADDPMFAVALVVRQLIAEEREACARAADERAAEAASRTNAYGDSEWAKADEAEHIAAAIRARGQ